MTNENKTNMQYFGDGVYADIEYGLIQIRVNDHKNEPVVYLDRDVLAALFEYAKKHNMIK